MSVPPLRAHALRIAVGDDDLPEDRFTDHVNNARYFAFINRTFHGWYVAMGFRGRIPGRIAVMAHLEYDFLGEVKPPGVVECRIEVSKVGRTSMTHAIEMHELGRAPHDAPRRVGRGLAVHVWIERSSGRASPWPPEVLADCWGPRTD
jgi:acyl-CoA thioesterase FadM